MEPRKLKGKKEMSSLTQEKQEIPEKSKYPVYFDLRNYIRWQPPKNQGYCAASWAFAAVGSLEGFWNKNKLGIPGTTFSEQQLVDCDLNNQGCKGGSTIITWAYVKNKEALTTDKFLPYVVNQEVCTIKKEHTVVGIKDSFTLSPEDEEGMAHEIYMTGPLAHSFYVIPDEFVFY